MAKSDNFGLLLSKVIEFRRKGGLQESLDTADLRNGSSEKKNWTLSKHLAPSLQENLSYLEDGISNAVGYSIGIKPVSNDNNMPSK